MSTFEEQLRKNEANREEKEEAKPKKKHADPITTLPAGAKVIGKKQQILGAKDIEYEYIPVPEWAETPEERNTTYVKIRSMNGQQRDAFEDSVVGKGAGKGKDKDANIYNIRAKICALHIVDENDKHLFSWEDIEALGEKSAKPLERISDRAQVLSAITNADVEELAKNSEITVSDTSSSNSP